MIEATYNFDEVEDPPSRWFELVRSSFSKILEDQIFSRFNQKTTLSIVFVGDPRMKLLNTQYRGKNSTTDVLTFPLNEKMENEYLLGEIIVSLDKAKTDSEIFGISFFHEIMQLLIHGMAHLLGYDHKNDKQEREMKLIENYLLKLVSFSEGAPRYE